MSVPTPAPITDPGRRSLLEAWKSERSALVARVSIETGFRPLVIEVVLTQIFDFTASADGDADILRRAARELHRAEREQRAQETTPVLSSGTASIHTALIRALRPALERLDPRESLDALLSLSAVFERFAALHAEISQMAVHHAAERRAAELERALESLSAAQDMLMHQARIKAMGSLADGVAHDVNNSLNAVLLRTTLLSKQVEGKARTHLEAIETVVRHAASTVQRLQEFARRRTVRSRAACDPSSVATEAVEMARPHWTNRAQLNSGYIDVRLEAPQGLSAVQIDAAELRAILVDLLLNATEAIEGDGLIEVQVISRPDHVEIEVRDDGPGIPAEHLRRIFEPFFTTRGPRSSGLGLAMAWGVLDRVGGSIAVENRPEGGAAFRVTIPYASTDAATETVRTPARARSVLLVDDDADSRETLEQILVLKGHDVELAADGRQALARYSPDRHEAVLCDVSMPNMNGLQLARAIREQNPDALIALLTGWSADDVEADVRGFVNAVFRKPIDVDAIEQFLSQAAGASGKKTAQA